MYPRMHGQDVCEGYKEVALEALRKPGRKAGLSYV
jgi:hypothetical protein